MTTLGASTRSTAPLPPGAVSVRVSAVMNDGVNSGANPQSAFFDDLSLTLAASPTNDADFNNDGIVDGEDFLIWQRGFRNQLERDQWRRRRQRR